MYFFSGSCLKTEVFKQPYLLISLRKYNIKVAPIHAHSHKSVLPQGKNYGF
jgi:hypothetical protein